MIKAVLFDWDLTLGRPLGDVKFQTRLSVILKNGGFNYSAQEILQALSIRSQKITNGEWEGDVYPQHREDIVRFYQQIVLILDNIEISEEIADEMRQSYAELPFILYRDTLPILRNINDHGYRTGVITNNSIRVEKVILNKVGKYIQKETITISDRVNIYKPDGEIFKIGAGKVGCEPNECVYIGDKLEFDAIAAIKNGGYKHAFWLNRKALEYKDNETGEGVTEIKSLVDLSLYLMKENTELL